MNVITRAALAVLATAALLVALPAAANATPSAYPPSIGQSGIPPEAHPEVLKVQCLIGSGSAFRIGPKTIVSVNHVTSLGGCFINGEPVRVVRQQGDFTVIDSDTIGPWMTVDCGGFVVGQDYVATGYARGVDTLTTVGIRAEGGKLYGFYRLTGVFHVIPGQSGGPVTDKLTGKVVGTINVYDPTRGYSGSIELRNTFVCGVN